MPKKKPYITPYGKVLVTAAITPELNKRVEDRAAKKCLTRSAYLVTLINADLEKAAEEEYREKIR